MPHVLPERAAVQAISGENRGVGPDTGKWFGDRLSEGDKQCG
jgi:hypothetical protein